jgi:prepilin-type N-terminal cleavage/methylation domain-containing protein
MRLGRYAAAAGRRLAAEGGYTLTELMIVLVILTIVVTSLVTLFVSASNAQVDLTKRFEAQQEMRLALDKLRREIHCASTVNGAPPTSSIDITLGAYCPTNKTGGVATVSWCTRDKNGNAPPGAGAPYSLRRYSGAACTGTFRKEANYLTIYDVFKAFPTPPAGQLATLSVELPVDVNPDAKQRYILKDDIALRNTTR